MVLRVAAPPMRGRGGREEFVVGEGRRRGGSYPGEARAKELPERGRKFPWRDAMPGVGESCGELKVLS